MSHTPGNPNKLLSEPAKEALLNFADEIDPTILTKGLRHLLFYYLRQEEDREDWFVPLLDELSILYELLEALGPPITS